MVEQYVRWDFIGLSTDTKPDSTNEKVTNGSTYYEANTSKYYVYYNGSWYEKTATGGGSTINVVQTTGQSTEDVMSQKAVTDTIENRLGGLTLLSLTQSEYDDLQSKDPDTLYIIKADE